MDKRLLLDDSPDNLNNLNIIGKNDKVSQFYYLY